MHYVRRTDKGSGSAGVTAAALGLLGKQQGLISRLSGQSRGDGRGRRHTKEREDQLDLLGLHPGGGAGLKLLPLRRCSCCSDVNVVAPTARGRCLVLAAALVAVLPAWPDSGPTVSCAVSSAV